MQMLTPLLSAPKFGVFFPLCVFGERSRPCSRDVHFYLFGYPSSSNIIFVSFQRLGSSRGHFRRLLAHGCFCNVLVHGVFFGYLISNNHFFAHCRFCSVLTYGVFFSLISRSRWWRRCRRCSCLRLREDTKKTSCVAKGAGKNKTIVWLRLGNCPKG